MSEDNEKIEKLAEEVMQLSLSTLMLEMRFLDAALAELTPIRVSAKKFTTDGTHLFYDPKLLLRKYASEEHAVSRDYMHVLLHCLLRHYFVTDLVHREAWDLACDIAVENTINELNMESLFTSKSHKQKKWIDDFKKDLTFLSAEKLYRYFLNEEVDDETFREIRLDFIADDHELWYQRGDAELSRALLADKKAASQSLSTVEPAVSDTTDSIESDSSEDMDGSRGNESVSSEQAMRWKEISERMQQDLETFSKKKGDTAGGLIQSLREVNRERYDYTAFLKRFAVMGEAMKINDDEFDYLFYTYGLKLYDRMPLIEPLEYKDVKRIREFAIIIDTSGSVEGELVQAFINKTYNILKSTESFFSKINLYIIQCDAEVQRADKITSQEEFDAYIKDMTLHGFGGTDFRPAFEYVDKLIAAGEFTRLKGVIYFTDGWGDFPAKKPAYDAAFVFIRDTDFNPRLPPWAIKLILDKDDV